MSAERALLELRGIELSFGGVRALSSVDLTVREGDIHAIIGPNGAGKSSLLNVISGLYRPLAGTIAFAGKDYTHVPVSALAHLGIARTFQNLALFAGMSVRDNIVMGRAAFARSNFAENVLGLPRSRSDERESARRAEEIMDFLGLHAKGDRKVATLPYGLQKRVELGRALIAGPRLLLLDEPMAGMGPEESARLVETLRQLKGSLTVLLIEHDMDAVFALADRISVLVYGRVIASGEAAAIRADPAVRQAYLGEIAYLGDSDGAPRGVANG